MGAVYKCIVGTRKASKAAEEGGGKITKNSRNASVIITCHFIFPVEGFNPEWNENMEFNVHVPELALVRFTVEDHDSATSNEFVGQYTLPFNSLRMGEFDQKH